MKKKMSAKKADKVLADADLFGALFSLAFAEALKDDKPSRKKAAKKKTTKKKSRA